MTPDAGRDTRPLGTATWADPKTAAGKYGYKKGTVWLGRLNDGTAVGYGDDRHVCLVSGNRGGKGTSLIVPNLCLWPGSLVVVDPKGENATVTAARRGAGSTHCGGMGQAVHVLDPFKAASVDKAYRSRFNPLDALDPSDNQSVDEAARLADAIVVVREDAKDPFWDDAARDMIKGLILHVLTAEGYEGRRNLLTVRQLLMRGDWQAVEVYEAQGGQDIPSAHELLFRDMLLNPALGGAVAGYGEALKGLMKRDPRLFEGMKQSVAVHTEFLESPALAECLTASDFKISDLKKAEKGVSLYLCLPQRYMQTHYRWLRMMIALVITEMEKIPGQPATGWRTLILLDEFAGLKRMTVVENAVAQIAGYGVKLFFVLQSLEQLRATYKDKWETFLTNAGLKVFCGLDDNFSRDYVSKLIGDTEVVRDVRSASESDSQYENRSQGWSESTGDSSSRSHSESGGKSTSTSRGGGGSVGSSWREGWLGADPDSRQFSSSMNESYGRTEGESWGWSDSTTAGSSRNSGTSGGTSVGTSRGRSAGSSETVHKRPLIAPDEIGRAFARIDERSDPLFPGLALAVISGAPPLIVRRTNYHEDYFFIWCFDPHPDHPFNAPVKAEVRWEALAPYLDKAGSLEIGYRMLDERVIVSRGWRALRVGFPLSRHVSDEMNVLVPCSGVINWDPSCAKLAKSSPPADTTFTLEVFKKPLKSLFMDNMYVNTPRTKFALTVTRKTLPKGSMFGVWHYFTTLQNAFDAADPFAEVAAGCKKRQAERAREAAAGRVRLSLRKEALKKYAVIAVGVIVATPVGVWTMVLQGVDPRAVVGAVASGCLALGGAGYEIRKLAADIRGIEQDLQDLEPT